MDRPEADPRYVMTLMPVLALLLGQLARRFSLAVALLACAGAITVVNLHRMNTYELRPETYPPANRRLAPLVSTLDRLGIDRVYAGYEIAYRLDFDAKEQIVAVMNESPLRFGRRPGHAAAETGHDPLARLRPDRPRGTSRVGLLPAGAPRERRLPGSPPPRYRSYPAGPYVVYAPHP